ncbi:hypothetical protein [Tardiphaga sp.]|uniref:hypothetical protein n=1 Tax=Tardiphaga sp. TaxID=1926292 RepID=UPI0026364DAF|nr:hypothetical protein [Tardiphaga sp.]MDB5618034.1 hypothetical protein [Tardiphaga sp.]
MRPVQRLVSAAVLIALSGALTGCGSMTGWDPSDMLDFLDTKKKLPGDRKPVFPEGVPGLQQGVPKELYKGNVEQQQRDEAAAAAAAAAAPPAAEPKGRKSKARVNVGAVRNSAPAAEPEAAEEGAAAAVPAEPKGRKIVRRRTTAPPAETSTAPAPQAAPAQPPSTSPFPAPVPSGTFTR